MSLVHLLSMYYSSSEGKVSDFCMDNLTELWFVFISFCAISGWED
ncbi:hypothetical protein HMPREF9441_01069 [Paraprevotella clara YIT 11840]|uniref:Uncharacterized protein n=1 Tax=Paraprevotella clara YIT 11840 TaxID=762968 RepID=G5SP73_9BACT|nr:hypothetical protein HMPREF9441_01069 [Paraprevotella clara YIT 11840]